MSYVYGSLTSPRSTTSGIGDYILIAASDQFEDDGIMCPEAPFTNPGDEVIIRTPHTFVDGEGFMKIALAPEKNQIELAGIGEKGFRKQDITLTAVIPGMYAEVMEAVKNWANKGFIVLAKDSDCKANQWYQIGCDCQFAYTEITGNTGTTRDGQKGYEVKFNCPTESLWIYAPQSGSPLADVNPVSQIKP